MERFGFPYDTLMDDRVRKGGLIRDYDIIILPEDDVIAMKGPADGEKPQNGYLARAMAAAPPEYRSGFGEEGVAALEQFVLDGGTLMTFGESGTLAIDAFDLPVRNVLEGLGPNEYWSPGSTLIVDVDNGHPLAWGMPTNAYALLWGGQAYTVDPSSSNDRVTRIAVFPDASESKSDILRSGWLLGEEVLAKKAAMLEVGHGEGRVVLIGFRPQHRAQTWGTFKLVFNGMIGG
jgi:hypothetical protein